MRNCQKVECRLPVCGDQVYGVLFALAMILLPGCISTESAKPRLLQGNSGNRMSKEDIQDALADFDDLFTANVKQAAIAIDEQSQVPAIRKNTLLWQVRMIPACQTALEEADPLKSYADMWTLCVRMSQFFQEGEGNHLFGDQQDIAVRTATQLEAEIEEVGKRFIPADQFNQIHESVQIFAKAHPIRTGFANAVVRAATAREREQDLFAGLLNIPLSPFRAMEGVDRGAQAIRGFTVVADRFTDIVDQMPEATRWQAELFLYDLQDSSLIRRFLAAVDQFVASAASMATTADKLPEQLRQQSVNLVKEIEDHQAALQETLNRAEKVATTVERALDRVDVVANSIDRTARSVTETGNAWQTAATTIGQTVKDLSSDRPSTAQPASTQPFDINDYRTTAEAMTQTAKELEKLTLQIQQLVDSPRLSQHIEDVDARTQAAVEQTTTRARGLTDHIAWRGGELAVFIFALALGYRFITSRLTSQAR